MGNDKRSLTFCSELCMMSHGERNGSHYNPQPCNAQVLVFCFLSFGHSFRMAFFAAPYINIRVDCENRTSFAAQGEAHREIVTTGSAAARTRGESGHPPSNNEIMRLIALKVLQSDAQFNQGSFINYLQEVNNLLLIDIYEGSLIFTVQCGSLEILEGLLEDHRSGHLREMAQQYLVTDDILRKFGEIEVNLTITIEDAEYEACKDFFLQQSSEYERTMLDYE